MSYGGGAGFGGYRLAGVGYGGSLGNSGIFGGFGGDYAATPSYASQTFAVPTTVYRPVTRIYTVPVRSVQTVEKTRYVPVTSYRPVTTAVQVPVTTYQTVQRTVEVPTTVYRQVRRTCGCTYGE